MTVAPRGTGSRKLALLAALYFVQGLPFGVQSTALPVALRERGASLAAIGFLGLLALPWSAKALWAPLVDRHGARKAWIVPLQLLLAGACAAASALGHHVGALLALVFLMNLFAATMDVAVDGVAVDLLEPHELGAGNAAQVVGYKAGMLTGGGLLLWAVGDRGLPAVFGAMAALVLALTLATLGFREPPHARAAARAVTASTAKVVGALVAALRAPGAGWALAFIATYKLGETMVEVMWKPFLRDAGIPGAQIGLYVGTYGMAASLAGSLVGGWLATRLRPVAALGVAAALRVPALAGQALLAWARPLGAVAVVASTAAEHFFAGIVTTAMFTFMMARVDRRIGATHYTFLATVEVLGKSPGAWASGLLAQRFGYRATFSIGVALAVAFLLLLLLVPVTRAARRSA